MSNATWHGDWPGRVRQRVQALGFESLTAFAKARPTATLPELAATLGENVATIQVERLLRLDAAKAGTIESFARDMLARCVRERLHMGWKNDARFGFRRAWAFASWSTSMDLLVDDACRDQVWNVLEHGDIPTGWLPSGLDDPIIERAFAGVRFDVPVSEG